MIYQNVVEIDPIVFKSSHYPNPEDVIRQMVNVMICNMSIEDIVKLAKVDIRTPAKIKDIPSGVVQFLSGDMYSDIIFKCQIEIPE